MPLHGIESVTVPGAVDGSDTPETRRHPDIQNTQPAATLAEQGFGITECIRNVGSTAPGSVQRSGFVQTYLVNGNPPATYSTIPNPDLAHTFRLLQIQGRDVFYKGEIAKAIVAKTHTAGGTMTLVDLGHPRDLESCGSQPTTTDMTSTRCPPSTQGFAVLEMMNILEVCAPRLGMNLAALGPRSPEYWHLLVEAKKLAYTDLYAYNGDPGFTQIPTQRLISKAYAGELCGHLDPKKAATPEPKGIRSGHRLSDSRRPLGQHGVIHLQRL